MSKKRQVGVVPVRRKRSGETEILLITTRGKDPNWIVPKGKRSHRLSDRSAAAREAAEEAGVAGRVSSKPVGNFKHRRGNGKATKVDVYQLEVTHQSLSWPERKQRKRTWASRHTAGRMVTDPSLKAVIDNIPEVSRRGEQTARPGRCPSAKRRKNRKNHDQPP
jgi:8-oxo-dGTP pyrophosphatase MutT (NUDIX family)